MTGRTTAEFSVCNFAMTAFNLRDPTAKMSWQEEEAFLHERWFNRISRPLYDALSRNPRSVVRSYRDDRGSTAYYYKRLPTQNEHVRLYEGTRPRFDCPVGTRDELFIGLDGVPFLTCQTREHWMKADGRNTYDRPYLVHRTDVKSAVYGEQAVDRFFSGMFQLHGNKRDVVALAWHQTKGLYAAFADARFNLAEERRLLAEERAQSFPGRLRKLICG